MTLHRCQAVALDSSRPNPSIRLLIAVKLMDVIVTPLAQCRDTAFPLEEGSATVVNKLPIFRLICDHCDIFAASHNSGLRVRLHEKSCNYWNRSPLASRLTWFAVAHLTVSAPASAVNAPGTSHFGAIGS